MTLLPNTLKTLIVPSATLPVTPYTLERLVTCSTPEQFKATVDEFKDTLIGRDIEELMGIIDRDYQTEIMERLSEFDYSGCISIQQSIERPLQLVDFSDFDRLTAHYRLEVLCDLDIIITEG